MAVHSHCVRTLKVSYSDVGKGRVAENCEKNTIFPEHPVLEMQLPCEPSCPSVSWFVRRLVDYFISTCGRLDGRTKLSTEVA